MSNENFNVLQLSSSYDNNSISGDLKLVTMSTVSMHSSPLVSPTPMSRTEEILRKSIVHPSNFEPLTKIDAEEDDNDYFFPMDDDGFPNGHGSFNGYKGNDSSCAQVADCSIQKLAEEPCQPVDSSMSKKQSTDPSKGLNDQGLKQRGEQNIEKAASCLQAFFFGDSGLPSLSHSEVETPSDRKDSSTMDTPVSSSPRGTQSDQSRKFSMLQSSDRSNSMPTDRCYFGSCGHLSLSERSAPGLTRKSSMKKISSIGTFNRGSSSASLKREVSFSNLEIRQYDVALSDHPSCSYGPPVQLSWEYQKERLVVPVESYEQSRSPRREKEQLVLSYNERRHMLLKQAGYSKKEIKKAMKEVQRVKNERLVTDILLPASVLDEAVEASVDFIKQFFIAPKDRQEQSIGSESPSLSYGLTSPSSVMLDPNDIMSERRRENTDDTL